MFVTARFVMLVAVGIIPVVLFGVAGLSPWIMLALWLVLCLAIAAIDAARAASRFEIVRDGTTRARLAEPVATGLWITNTSNTTAHLTIRDAWQPTAGASSERQHATIAPGERGHVDVPLLPRRRGELRSEFVALRSAGTFGIAGRQIIVREVGVVRVLPPFRARRHLPSRIARLKELDGNTSLQVRGQGTEFDSLREYVRGDDVRSIDWRATARSATTMLRTWRPERDRHVVILVDTGRTSAVRLGDETRLDTFFEATLLLAALAQRAGDHVHVVLFDRTVRARVTGVDGTALMPALVDAMAPVEAQLIDTNWDAAIAEVRSLTTRPSLVVLLTAQDAPGAARGFLTSLQQLASRTRVVVGSATDSDLGEIAANREGIEEIYRAAAAEQTRHEAALVARAIERAHADAITTSADALPPAIADRYLELKRLGRL